MKIAKINNFSFGIWISFFHSRTPWKKYNAFYTSI